MAATAFRQVCNPSRKRIDADSICQGSVSHCTFIEEIPCSVYQYQLFETHEEPRDHEIIELNLMYHSPEAFIEVRKLHLL